jgi:effector-binding domain-containing protein
MSNYELKHLEPVRALRLRFLAKSHLHFAQAVAEVRTAARAHAVQGTGYPIQIVYAGRYVQDDVESEFAIPVAESWTESLPLATFGAMTVSDLPAATAAVYLHEGSPETLNDGLADLERWAAAQSYRPGGWIRLVYRRGFVVPLPTSEWQFEVQHGLEKVP